MIEGRKPRAIFIENVKNMVGHDHGNTFKVIREALTENNYFIKWKVTQWERLWEYPTKP